jgi:hypothetical protein
MKGKRKNRVDWVALGSIGSFCIIKRNGPIEPHTALVSSFALFFFCCGHCLWVRDRVLNELRG